MALKSSRRSELRAEAHKLSPVVIIGDKGLTDAVIAEIDRSLKTHELIKVRAGTDDREARGTWMATLCEKLGADAVQSIGKVLVLYRENPKEKLDSRPRANDKPVREKAKRERAKPTFNRLKSKAERGKVPFERGKTRSPRAKPMERSDPTGTSRLRSRTPSAPPESEPRRRRPRSSR